MYRRGGLAFHSGLKVMDLGDGPRVLLIVGLSGTGKTTTTFSEPEVSRPRRTISWRCSRRPGVRDRGWDIRQGVRAHPDIGAGIWPRAIAPDTYLENVAIDSSGKVDFGDKRYREHQGDHRRSHLPGFLPRPISSAPTTSCCSPATRTWFRR